MALRQHGLIDLHFHFCDFLIINIWEGNLDLKVQHKNIINENLIEPKINTKTRFKSRSTKFEP